MLQGFLVGAFAADDDSAQPVVAAVAAFTPGRVLLQPAGMVGPAAASGSRPVHGSEALTASLDSWKAPRAPEAARSPKIRCQAFPGASDGAEEETAAVHDLYEIPWQEELQIVGCAAAASQL